MKTHAFKYRFYPTVEQKQLLSHTFGCVRFVYNTILFERLELYKKEGKRTSYSQASSMLTTLKRNTDYAWLKEVSCVPLQQSLRHQQTAFKNFFENRAKYPKFKKKEHKQSAEFTAKAFTYRNGSLCMAKSKTPLNIKWSRKLPCSPSTIIISKDCSDRYFVSCRIEREIKKLPKINQSIGIDLGIKEIAITSGGFKFENKRYTKRYALKLAKAQR
jgi:putative transposase